MPTETSEPYKALFVVPQNSKQYFDVPDLRRKGLSEAPYYYATISL